MSKVDQHCRWSTKDLSNIFNLSRLIIFINETTIRSCMSMKSNYVPPTLNFVFSLLHLLPSFSSSSSSSPTYIHHKTQTYAFNTTTTATTNITTHQKSNTTTIIHKNNPAPSHHNSEKIHQHHRIIITTSPLSTTTPDLITKNIQVLTHIKIH
jgi:ABC-type sulfate/molybdate transport systems ATPase subunit